MIIDDPYPFLDIHTIVVYALICLYTLEAYIANYMDPDQTAPVGAVWSGFIVFASMIKISLIEATFEYIQQTQ